VSKLKDIFTGVKEALTPLGIPLDYAFTADVVRDIQEYFAADVGDEFLVLQLEGAGARHANASLLLNNALVAVYYCCTRSRTPELAHLDSIESVAEALHHKRIGGQTLKLSEDAIKLEYNDAFLAWRINFTI